MNGEPLMPWVCAPMLPRPKPLRNEYGSSSVAVWTDRVLPGRLGGTEEQPRTATRQEEQAGPPALSVYLGRTC